MTLAELELGGRIWKDVQDMDKEEGSSKGKNCGGAKARLGSQSVAALAS